MAALTPMMQQYLQIKEQNKDSILMFRLGDFYEMFFEDAEIASRELEITLTGRDCGQEERAPMCGVPFHAVEAYIAKLIQKGFKVAICEQLEDPSEAKGIVKRDVIRIITPGTITDTSMLDEKKNNYLMCIYKEGNCYGLTTVDISTGDFSTTQLTWGITANRLMDEIARFQPAELVVNPELVNDKEIYEKISTRFDAYITTLPKENFFHNNAEESIRRHFSSFSDDVCAASETGAGAIAAVRSIRAANDSTMHTLEGLLDKQLSLSSSGALLEYLYATQKVNLTHIREIKKYSTEEFMVLDISTRRNLEITETMREKNRKGSLIWVLDKTATSMGGRMLRKWLEMPLLCTEDINSRLDAVEELKNNFMVRSELFDGLKKVYDIERLMSKVVYGSANCRDLISLKTSLGQVPGIKSVLECSNSAMLKEIHEDMDELGDVYELIDASIIEEPPISLREGGLIKSTFHPEVERLRNASTEGKNWIAALENSEREKTGIKNLKISYNRVFGYYIEVTKSNFSLVPEHYIRKQTLANCERYITQELKEIEDTILGAEEKVIDLEYKLFVEVRNKVSEQVDRIKKTASLLAQLDVLNSLAEVAEKNNYCRPEMHAEGKIVIKDGRHPVVEKMLTDSLFVPNDTLLDKEENRLSVITGPNMAGKSTFLRQTALIVLMSQIGSFVPAKNASIGIADRIFTRVGASDDLASGQSTFMVEMSEVANILRNATSKSILILDEIGRGTSTFDGLSIAWSVIEYINDKNRIGARTLFATHYHELTELEGKLKGVKNYCISVKERGEDIIFLRKIIRGGADGSYGIQVARLAGLPEEVILRSKEILEELEDADISKKESRLSRLRKPLEGQLDLFTASFAGNSGNEFDSASLEVVEEIKKVDISSITPIEAMNLIFKLQKKINP